MTAPQPCAAFVPLLARAADGDLDPGTLARVESHAASCDACRTSLDAQRAIHRLLGQAEAWQASPAFESRVAAAVASRAPWTEQWDWRRWTWRLTPVAAAVVIAAIVGVVRADRSTETTTTATSALPVSAALWTGEVSDTSVLALMLQARPSDPLSQYVNGGRQ
jgi:predicted anti-sigma-YlaC factor YlaD